VQSACRAKNCTQHPVTDAITRSLGQSVVKNWERKASWRRGGGGVFCIPIAAAAKETRRKRTEANALKSGPPPPPHLLCERTNAAHANPQTDIQNRTSVSLISIPDAIIAPRS